MSRYRPPRPKSSPYITQAGHSRLQQELSYLWKVQRPAVTRKVSEAAAMGDRSENAEYIYGKRQLREIDSRIQFLSRRLDDLQVIEHLPKDRNTVYFGAWVTLEDADGQTFRYRIVGADEFDAEDAYISVDAPLARLLIGKHLDDEIIMQSQTEAVSPRILDPHQRAQEFHYVIVNITYNDAG